MAAERSSTPWELIAQRRLTSSSDIGSTLHLVFGAGCLLPGPNALPRRPLDKVRKRAMGTKLPLYGYVNPEAHHEAHHEAQDHIKRGRDAITAFVPRFLAYMAREDVQRERRLNHCG
jgi:hypothetical protein